jgi:hypothetical protein
MILAVHLVLLPITSDDNLLGLGTTRTMKN